MYSPNLNFISCLNSCPLKHFFFPDPTANLESHIALSCHVLLAFREPPTPRAARYQRELSDFSHHLCVDASGFAPTPRFPALLCPPFLPRGCSLLPALPAPWGRDPSSSRFRWCQAQSLRSTSGKNGRNTHPESARPGFKLLPQQPLLPCPSSGYLTVALSR